MSTVQSDTPRTDGFIFAADIYVCGRARNFMNELERENARLREALIDLMLAVDPQGELASKKPKLEPYFIAPLHQARTALETT